MMPAIINTLIMTLVSLVIAVPFGIFSAIYLVEYAKRGNKFVKVIRLTTETLSGIPSIVYGLFGFLFFVTYLKWGNSILAGAFTLAIMILPLIMRTTEEALKSEPGFLQGRKFWTGGWKAANSIQRDPADRNPWYSGRCDSGSWTNCGRDGGPHLYSGNCGAGSAQPVRTDGIRTYSGSTYV